MKSDYSQTLPNAGINMAKKNKAIVSKLTAVLGRKVNYYCSLNRFRLRNKLFYLCQSSEMMLLFCAGNRKSPQGLILRVFCIDLRAADSIKSLSIASHTLK